jgi:translation elongation factor EF-1alpha
MVTGASTAQLAIVLIDVRNGVITGSKRHGFIPISALEGDNVVNESERSAGRSRTLSESPRRMRSRRRRYALIPGACQAKAGL